MSPLYDAIRPLLRVAPSDFHLFDRDNPREVLLARENRGVWLSIASVPSSQRRDECRAIEWGERSLDDIADVHFFPSRLELLPWVSARLLAL